MSDLRSEPRHPLADLVAAQSVSITPRALGGALLREDSQAARRRANKSAELVEASLADGAMLAQQVSRRWGGDPDAIAAANRIPVVESESDAGYGTTLVFAQYRSRPLGIDLYRPVIAALDNELRRSRLAGMLGVDCTRAIFLAHELYHHFDEARAQPLCSRHRIPVLEWRWLRLSVPVPAMGEIAAGAFAQRLLGLHFHPRLLDLAAVSFWQPGRSTLPA